MRASSAVRPGRSSTSNRSSTRQQRRHRRDRHRQRPPAATPQGKGGRQAGRGRECTLCFTHRVSRGVTHPGYLPVTCQASVRPTQSAHIATTHTNSHPFCLSGSHTQVLQAAAVDGWRPSLLLRVPLSHLRVPLLHLRVPPPPPVCRALNHVAMTAWLTCGTRLLSTAATQASRL